MSEPTSKIKIKDAIAAKNLYVQGDNLSQICQSFPEYTRAQWRRVRRKERWNEARRAFSEDLKRTAKERLMRSKDLFSDSLTLLGQQLNEKIRAEEIRLETVADVAMLVKTIHLHLNDGSEKSSVAQNNEINAPYFSHLSSEKRAQLYALLKEEADLRHMPPNNAGKP